MNQYFVKTYNKSKRKSKTYCEQKKNSKSIEPTDQNIKALTTRIDLKIVNYHSIYNDVLIYVCICIDVF